MTQSESELFDLLGGPSPSVLEKLIYVVGSARGGTTLTKNVIGLHDSVVSFGGPSHFLNHPWRHRNRLEERLWRIVVWLPATVRHRVVRDAYDETRREVYLKYLNGVLARKNFRELYRLYPLIRALDPEEKRKPENFAAWLDKGNDLWGVNLLPAHFPEARFVFVVRHPCGSVASLSKRIADARADTEFKVSPEDVIRSTIYWRNLVQQQLRFAKRYPNRTIFFRFEDLVTRPLDIVPRLYEILELQKMPQATLSRRLANIGYGASLDGTELGKGLSTKPLERWRSALSDDAIDLISDICGPTARRFGYDLGSNKAKSTKCSIAARVPGGRDKSVVLAKLVYLATREYELGQTRSTFEPFKLLQV